MRSAPGDFYADAEELSRRLDAAGFSFRAAELGRAAQSGVLLNLLHELRAVGLLLETTHHDEQLRTQATNLSHEVLAALGKPGLS